MIGLEPKKIDARLAIPLADGMTYGERQAIRMRKFLQRCVYGYSGAILMIVFVLNAWPKTARELTPSGWQSGILRDWTFFLAMGILLLPLAIIMLSSLWLIYLERSLNMFKK